MYPKRQKIAKHWFVMRNLILQKIIDGTLYIYIYKNKSIFKIQSNYEQLIVRKDWTQIGV